MKSLRLVFGLLVVLAWLSRSPLWGLDAEPDDCVVLDIHEIGPARLAALEGPDGSSVWLELDGELFVCGADAVLVTLEDRAPVKRRFDSLAPERLRVAYKMNRAELEGRGMRVLAVGGPYAIVEGPESVLGSVVGSAGLLPIRSPSILARQVANQPARARPAAGEGTVAGLVAQIDSDRWFADVESLASYNRYSLGPEIDRARKWLRRQFRRLPGMKVRSRFFVVDGARVANVIATLPGRSRPDDWFIVGAHYDSTSDDPVNAAPGAEDNASGCAGVLELARIFAANPPETTMLFICYAGEEQGLIGSEMHAAELFSAGAAEKVGAMLNMDMIGFTEDADFDCHIQARAEDQFLLDDLSDSAARHTQLRLVTSNVIARSDHVPYALLGMPAVMSIENDAGAYPDYHRTTDTPDKLTPEMAAEILRMNIGALARYTGNSDVAGCLTVDGERLVEAKVVSIQPGEVRQKTYSDRRGCFAVDPVAREKSFKLKIKGPVLPGDEREVSACLRLLGEPISGSRVVFRQTGEAVQKARPDSEGCFTFEAAAGARFTLIFKGPTIPVEAS